MTGRATFSLQDKSVCGEFYNGILAFMYIFQVRSAANFFTLPARIFVNQTARKVETVSFLGQRIDLSLYQNNKDNISLQSKTWAALLTGFFKELAFLQLSVLQM